MGRHHSWLGLVVISTLFAGGCCCACNPSSFVRAVQNNAKNAAARARAESDAEESTDQDSVSGREYAQQALNNLGYGEIQSGKLTKGANSWSVAGVAGGKEGGNVNYEVLFSVLRSEGEGEIRLRWNVQSVTVNGEVVYP